MNELLRDLNAAQQQAVGAPLSNLLILAGAGSGKTRVLVHRIAWLMQQEHVSPFSILAVTFTNKAAHEMRARIEALLGASTQRMWIGTFHGLAHRLLRAHWKQAGLPEQFQILDSADQVRIIKRIYQDFQIDEERYPAKQAQWFINTKKDEGVRAKHLSENSHKPQEAMYTRIYSAYDAVCEQNGLVDFAELLLRSHELLANNAELRQHYQERFQHILVDEFQDTNAVQYAWIRLLAGDQTRSYTMVVGDDDQSIYSWRGACIDNLHRFKKDFKQVKSITLEQNYRSTSTILNAANALISFNEDRLGKELWTEGSRGEPLRLYTAYNELDEARFIADEIRQWEAQGHRLSEAAVLYRSNAQSRVLEEALIQKGVAYRIYGGLRFFERAEIKDALAYLRLANNLQDDGAFERIVNLPPRGIGNKTIETLREYAREHQLPLWDSTDAMIKQSLLSARSSASLSSFMMLMTNLQVQMNSMDLDRAIEFAIESAGLIDYFSKERNETGRARVENLRELVSAASEFSLDDYQELTPLTAFLSHAVLESGGEQASTHEDAVNLMTLHTAKGLEFPFVILCGMEEGLFPHQMSMGEPGRLEEERRLCYVGMTRAMKSLMLTYAESRRLYGQEHPCRVSRFVREIPAEYMEEVRLKSKISRPVSVTSKLVFADSFSQEEGGYYIGQAVVHPKFGKGRIVDLEGNGERMRVQVKFRGENKWLIASMAKLEPVD
jgi:DNA helicase-2/ATP-dependent DNA helicase PcrA